MMVKVRSRLSRFLKLFFDIRLEPLTPVDIVIPARNAGATLRSTVSSIQKQTHFNFKCWIVDDNSFDQTYLIAEELCKEDDRFHLIKTEKQRGPAGARNLGIEQGTAALIAFCDADDTWAFDKLERQVSLIEDEGSDVVLSGVCVHYPNYGSVTTERLFKKSMFRPEELIDRLFSFNMAVCGSNLLASRAALNDCRNFDPEFAPSDDYNVLLNLAFLQYRFSYDPRVTVNYIRNHSSITSCQQGDVLRAMRKCVAKWSAVGCKDRPAFEKWKAKANEILFEIPSDFENIGKGSPYFIANPYMLDSRGR